MEPISTAAGAAIAAKGLAAADPVSKEVVEAAMKELITRGKKVIDTSNEHFELNGRTMEIHCREGIQKCGVFFKPKDHKWKGNSVRYQQGVPSRVDLIGLMGGKAYPEAINLTNDGFILDLKKLPSDGLYSMNIEYELKEKKKVIDSLVTTTIPSDVPHHDQDEIPYEISAQIKWPELLKQEFYGINIKDLEIQLPVTVQEDVKLSIPHSLIEEAEAVMAVLKRSKDRDAKFAIVSTHRLLRAERDAENNAELPDVLRNVSNIFSPDNFRKFITVAGGFNYDRAVRGTDYYEAITFPNWPKSMTIISEADLSLDEPAKEGKIIYKRNMLISDVKDAVKGTKIDKK